MAIQHSEETDALFRSVLALESVEECYAYFEDLCTVKEVRDLSQRLEVARLLDAGSSYQQAAAATGASSTTIGRVKRCLEYGTGGYRMVLGRLKEAGARDDG